MSTVSTLVVIAVAFVAVVFLGALAKALGKREYRKREAGKDDA